MIINGDPGGNVSFWSKHLMRTDTNDRVEIKEVRGTVAQDLKGALVEMEAIASCSRSQGNFLYQANINPLAHEHLTPEQWMRAVDLLEERMGFTDHQRVVVEHVKNGRQHYHVIWNRVDVESLRVADVGGNYYTHERVARELEQEFGLEKSPRVHGERDGPRRSERPVELWERERGEKSGIDPKAIKAELTEIWRTTPTAEAFVAALDERGYALARGDQREFVVVDSAGDAHSLARRIQGARAADVRERLQDIDKDRLPTVAEAKQTQRARFTDENGFDRSAAAQAWADRPPLPTLELRNADRADAAKLREGQGLEVAQTIREQKGEEFKERREERHAKAQQDHQKKVAAQTREPMDVAHKAFMVLDTATGAVTSVIDFVAGILSSGPPEPPKPPSEQLIAQRRARAAAERMADAYQRGETFSASDLHQLLPTQLKNIHRLGDDYVRQLVDRQDFYRKSTEQERERER